MPQASDELRAKMLEYFGSLDCEGPETFLLSQGWLHINHKWSDYKEEPDITKKEWDCIDFLCDEWDQDYEPREPHERPQGKSPIP